MESMKKAIFFKEWLKTRRFFALSVFISLCFVLYALLRINRVVEFKGAGHLWEVLIQKEVVMIEVLKYIPLLVGLLLGIVQFVPEMLLKRLKLTLHLPYSGSRMMMYMIGIGVSLLFLVFLLNYLILGVYLQVLLPAELTVRMLLTALPWYLAGFAAYFFTAWICLEPTWKRRIINALLAMGILRLFFLNDNPQAYDGMLIWFLVYLVSIGGLALLSVKRFKEGCED